MQVNIGQAVSVAADHALQVTPHTRAAAQWGGPRDQSWWLPMVLWAAHGRSHLRPEFISGELAQETLSWVQQDQAPA